MNDNLSVALINDVLGNSHCDLLLEAAIKKLEYRYSNYTVDETYQIDGVTYTPYSDEHTYDKGHHCCVILDTNGNIHNDAFFHLALPIFLSAKDIYPELNIEKLLRMKVNALEQQSDFPDYCYNIPHHDAVAIDKQLYSIVYYLNDSDGDTYLFNEYVHDDKELSSIKSVSLHSRLKPKRNSLSLFHSNRLHAGSNPKITKARYVINMVVESK